MIDATHDPALLCWVQGAAGHADFPIQNLPLGVVAPGGAAARGGIAIGDHVLDLPTIAALLTGSARQAAEAACASSLNALFALGAAPRRALRAQVSALLSDASARDRVAPALFAASACTPHLPACIGDYTDFYAGIHHARGVGALFRPDQPLMANYKHVPIGYHGRASSVVVSGTAVRRPCGQTRPAAGGVPGFGPSRSVDFELEMAVWIGPGNALGEPIPVADARAHVAGYGLLNDWSARDIQAWEYQPLGPFLGKSFATTVSPWVVTPEALAPFRTRVADRPEGDPRPLPYLTEAAGSLAGLSVALDVLIETALMRRLGLPPHLLSASDARHMYWTVNQMVAHHSSNGCNLRAGDLFGTGTLSAPEPGGLGSMLELTRNGRAEIMLPSGEQRGFLADGDTIVLRARAEREGFTTIGFGECRGTIVRAISRRQEQSV